VTLEEIADILGKITFAPSCVDMGWAWEVEPVFVIDGPHRGACGDDYSSAGFRLRTTFKRPDRVTGELQTGKGRWWEVPEDVSLSGVVKTAFAASKMILEHELMESFKFEGARIFDPHNEVKDLARVTAR
jgi:hypothetical protein